MTVTLVSSWAFSPWRLEAATTAAAYLMSIGVDELDVVRADLDMRYVRENPRPAVDALLARVRSLPGYPQPPATWADLGSYAASAAQTADAWLASGCHWAQGYSGPGSGADHLTMALLRHRGVLPLWTAHLTGTLSHADDGRLLGERVGADPMRSAAREALTTRPPSDLVSDWLAALIAAHADMIVVASEHLRDHFLALPSVQPYRDRVADRVRVWSRPGVAAPSDGPSDRSSDPARSARETRHLVVTTRVDAERLPSLVPVLTAYGLLSAHDREQVQLRVLTNDPTGAAIQLRRSELEGLVSVEADASPVVSAERAAQGDFALVVDRPAPEGLGYALGDLPELADHAACGTAVILLCPQDSPLSRYDVAHHLPAGNVSAALALLRCLAGST